MTGRLVRILKRWTGFAKIACSKLKKKMSRPVKFTPANLQHRGTAYQKHHERMIGGSRRFIANEPCPICGDYLRRWRTQREDQKTSACVSCLQEAKNKKADKVKCDKRRAIEEHQNKMGDYDDYL